MSTLGHGYFAESGPVLYDIFYLMNSDVSAEDRQRLHWHEITKSEGYWAIAK